MTTMAHTFDPEADDGRAFRDALGKFGTGVTLVTCSTPEGPLGITANSFASVSLDPPLVLWSPAKSSRRYAPFMAAQHFAIHVMGVDQRQICAGFVQNGSHFDQVAWAKSPEGVPLLDGCLARFECATHAQHDAGDHTIIVGRVLRAATDPGVPLLFYSGAYGGFTKVP